MKELTTKQAVKKLVTDLKNNPGYRIGWLANIAVCFQDEWQRAVERGGLPHTPNQIHEISNKAADNFLNILCMDPDQGEGE